MPWWDDHPSISAASAPAPAAAPAGAAPWWDAHPDISGAPGAAPPPPAAPADSGPRKPEFGSDDYIKLIAEKHKIAPDYVRGIVNSQTQGEALKGVPLLGAGVDRAGSYAAAIAHGFTGAGASGDSVAERATKNMALNQEIAEDFTREHPYLSAASNVTGGLLATAPLAATGLGARLLGLTARNLPAAAAVSGATGAAINSADSALRGEDPGRGALIGLATGLAAPFVGRGLGRAWEAFKPAPTAAGISEVPSAGKALLRASAADNLTEDNIQGKLAELGPLGMMADLGPNLRTQAEVLVNSPGANLKIGQDALNARAAGAPDRMSKVIDQTIGAPQDVDALHDGLTAIQKHDAGPLYQQVHASQIEQTPTLTEALARPSVKVAFQKGARMAANEGGGTAPTNMAILDYTKQALDDMVSTQLRQGNNNLARTMMSARDALVNELDRQVPLYAQARNAYAGPAKIKDAIESGGNLFKKAVTPGEIESAISTMSDSERMGYLAGARSALGETMQQAGNPAMAAQKLFSSGWNQQKLNSLIGPDRTETLLEHLNQEKTFADTHAIIRDPRTAARVEAQKEFPSEFETPTAPDVDMTLTGLGVAAARKIYSAGAGHIIRNLAAEKKVAAARSLFAQGDEAADVAEAIAKHPATRATLQAERAKFAHISAFGSLPPTAMASVQPPQGGSGQPPALPPP